jgi:hypothetical protein
MKNKPDSPALGDRVYVEAMHGRGGGFFGTLVALTSDAAQVATPAGTRCWAGLLRRDVVTSCLPCQLQPT